MAIRSGCLIELHGSQVMYPKHNRWLSFVHIWMTLVALFCIATQASAQFNPITIDDEEVREHVLGALEYLRSSDPDTWGTPEQQRATALAILIAVDTAYSRGLSLIADQPLETQVAAFRSPEFMAITDAMPETTTSEIASKLVAKLIMGESGGSLRRRLIEAQNADGSWGLKPGRSGNPLDTSLVVISLLGVRALDVPTDVCLSAAEYLAATRNSGAAPDRSNMNFGPLWPLSAENDGESHVECAAYGLHALRLLSRRVSNNDTRSAMNDAQGYIAAAIDQGSAATNTTIENALAFIGSYGLYHRGNPGDPIRQILDNDSQTTPYAWTDEDNELDAYTTAVAVRAIAMWLPEQGAGKPDLTTLAADLIVDTATNKLRVLYRNQGESPAASSDSFTVGEVFLEGVGPSLIHDDQFVPEDSYVEASGQLILASVGPGINPIAVTTHLDPDNAINEDDESNNIVTYPLDRNRMGFDLAISPPDIWFEADPSGWLVHATFRTVGREILTTDQSTFIFTLESSSNGMFWTTDGVVNDIQYPDVNTIEVTWLDSTPPTNNRHYRARVSSSKECSGCLANSSAIVVVTPAAVNDGDNIAIDMATTDPASPNIGATVSVDVAGTASFTATAPTVSIKVYEASNLTSALGELTSFQVAGSWTATVTDIELPAPTISFSDTGSPQAVTKLLVHVDAGSVFAESNEGDNWYPLEILYNDRVDLVLDPSSFTVSNTDLAYTPEVEVSVGLRNTGPAQASLSGTTVEFSISFDDPVQGPLTETFAIIEPGSMSLDFGEGVHLSALLTPPVGDVTITAHINYSGPPNELSDDNNTVTKEVIFTRETLTISLLPNYSASNNHYNAGDSSVRSYNGIIVQLGYSPPANDPLDPTDGVDVTYEAYVGETTASSDDLVTLVNAFGQRDRYRIPLQYLQTEPEGEYAVHAYAYEDGRLSSTVSRTFHIESYNSQSVSASVVPAEQLDDGDFIYDLGGPSHTEPSLFLVLSSVANTTTAYDYRATFEYYDESTDMWSYLRDPAVNTDDVIEGEIGELPPGAVSRRADIVIPGNGIYDDPNYTLPEGLYRFHVTVTADGTSEPVLCEDWAAFRVAKPDDYVLLEKVFRVNGQVVEALQPIEGQEVEVTLTLKREN